MNASGWHLVPCFMLLRHGNRSINGTSFRGLNGTNHRLDGNIVRLGTNMNCIVRRLERIVV